MAGIEADRNAVAAELFGAQGYPQGFPYENFDVTELILPDGDNMGINSDDDDIDIEEIETASGFGNIIGARHDRLGLGLRAPGEGPDRLQAPASRPRPARRPRGRPQGPLLLLVARPALLRCVQLVCRPAAPPSGEGAGDGRRGRWHGPPRIGRAWQRPAHQRWRSSSPACSRERGPRALRLAPTDQWVIKALAQASAAGRR
jgi:hypothetical protein